MDKTKQPKRGGKNRKSNETHVVNGTFRHDRHGSADAYRPGEPRPTAELGDLGQKLWAEVTSNLPASALATVDGFKLTLLCQSWEMLYSHLALWQADPGNNTARLSVQQLTQTVDRLGKQFGMSPRDRQQMSRVGWGEEKQEDVFAAFMRGAD
jgi:phage terminase small subunit